VLASTPVSHHPRILLALILGAIAGVVTNVVTDGGDATKRFVSLVTEPVGRMWLSALIMTVVPLIMTSLPLGVAGLGNLREVGRVGALTFALCLALTTISAIIALGLTNTFRPGDGLDPVMRAELMDAYGGEAQNAAGLSGSELSLDMLVKIVPRNPVKAAAEGDMLAIIFFSLMLGIAIASLPREKSASFTAFLESLGYITVEIIHLVMKLAPIGVFCLIFSVTARFGFDLLVHLAKYVILVIGGLLVMMTVVYGLVLKFAADRNPLDFMKRARVVVVTAFSTSSSNATLPTALDVAQSELGIRKAVAGFVLPLGATMNQNGTSLFEGVTVLFLAQVFGIDLSLGQQILVIVMSVITALGAAGVPGGSIPLLILVLGMFGIPPEGIAIVLGVDRILDMCRTVVNVIGDIVIAAIVERVERRASA
jgi:dicarboxylate/amino acid:cation (Na+ or H+) symporter, DAACS family